MMKEPANKKARSLTDAIRRRFAALGGFDFDPPRRDAMRRAPEFVDDRSSENRLRTIVLGGDDHGRH
jgi:hypothetical protein